MTPLELLKASLRWRYDLIPLPLSYGAPFRRWRRFLAESPRYTQEQLETYVWQRLKALIDYAYTNTDYYRNSFRSLGCEPGDVKTFADYSRLPIINRATVRDHLDEMKSERFAETNPILTVTSGTTGYPLTLYRSRQQESLRKAVIWRQYNDVGYRFKQRRATLGRPIDFPEKQVFVHYDRLENNLELNTFHLNPTGFEKLHAQLTRFQPQLLVGHPAALYTFCLQAEKCDLPIPQIPLIFSISEKLYPHHIARFTESFGARVYDYYGNRENALAVSQFSCGSYHINSEFGHVEFIAGGAPVASGKTGSIIATPLENYSVPLLRYDTGDLGIPRGPCAGCSRPHPTMEILGGRGKDVLVTRDGFVNCHLDTYLARSGFRAADYLQVVQKDIEWIVVRILPNASFRQPEDQERLVRLTSDCLGGYFHVTVELLTEPPFTEAGKMPYVVSKLAPSDSRP